MDYERLEQNLTRLKLITVRDRLDSLLDDIARQEMTVREAIGYLCEQELRSKNQKRVQMGISLAKFPFLRTLEQFDFSSQPSLDPSQIRDLSTCRWISNGDALLLLGPPGVGKTHLAVAKGILSDVA